MSGICGVIHFDGRPGVSEGLAAMTAAAVHRGPDGIRRWTEGGVGLAHLALHVTPEDERETQPLVDDSLVLVADARIDNRSELQSSLRTVLRTAAPTDADLILAAYRRWGTDCAQHLIGDFAFAIWDERERRLFAARDPMGMRSLYYCAEPQRLLFATEIQQLQAVSGRPRRYNERMLAAYAVGHFEDVKHTFYDGILAVQPGHRIEVDASGLREDRFWDIDPVAQIHYRDERDYVAHFREVFAEAVRCRLRGPRPVGLLLSGGVDSTSIAIMAGWLREQGEAVSPLRTYSFGFRTLRQCDERFISDSIVDRFGLPSTVLDVESIPLVSRSPEPLLEQPYVSGFHHLLLEAYDEAQGDGARVMLSGHRGDLMVGGEIFDYSALLRSGQWGTLLRELSAHAHTYGTGRRSVFREHLVTPMLAGTLGTWMRKGASAIRGWLRDPEENGAHERRLPEWYTSAWAPHVASLTPSRSVPNGIEGMRAERYRLFTLGGHMLGATRNDFDCARAHLASADPWSDRRLFEFIMAIPPHVVCRAGENKWIVGQALRQMGEEVGAQKITPEPLYVRALKRTERTAVLGLLESSQLESRGYVEGPALRQYYDEYRRGTANDYRFWYTLILERWLRQQHNYGLDPRSEVESPNRRYK